MKQPKEFLERREWLINPYQIDDDEEKEKVLNDLRKMALDAIKKYKERKFIYEKQSDAREKILEYFNYLDSLES